MPEKFDWQAEDDDVWNNLPAEEETGKTSGKRRRWPFLLLLVLLMAGASAVILRQVNQRVETNSEAMRTDIESSHNIMQVADEELRQRLEAAEAHSGAALRAELGTIGAWHILGVLG